MIDWQNIRVHNNSQNNAFEELVCQLARRNIPCKASRFLRLGTPDGGIECFWELTDSTEIGWQAKYVFNVEDLISQVNKSIRTAIKNHPTMSQYIVATPFNLPDPHYTGKAGRPVKSSKTKWDEKVASWVEELSTEQNSIEVILWNESHLNDLLITPQNEGLRYYWFRQNEFTLDRFQSNLNSAIADLGPRYTSELNVELPISSYFDYLFHNERPLKSIQKYCFDLRKNATAILNVSERTCKLTDLTKEYAIICSEVPQILELLSVPSYYEMQCLKINDIVKHFDTLDSIISDIAYKLEEKLGEKEFLNSFYFRDINSILELINNGKEFFSPAAQLINSPYMILHGEPGIGKSHLLADVCLKQIQKGIPVILLLGDQFSCITDPRECIKQHIQYPGSFISLLQLLNSIGQIYNQRVLIAIDALNEGDGVELWGKYLAGIETEIKQFPWIALAVSVRTDYLDDIIPEKCRDSMIQIEHRGFDESFEFACEHFFRVYGLDFGIPIFNNEFSNPLFLKLFCESCRDAGYPQSLPSLTRVLDGYIEHTNFKLFKQFRYEKSLCLVRVAAVELAKILMESDSYAVLYADLQSRIDDVVSKSISQKSTPEYLNFLDALIKEDIFRAYSGHNGEQKRVGFAYDRMRDYFTLLQKLKEKPEDIEITEYVRTSPYFEKCWRGRGTGGQASLELLAIILPELCDIEIIECSSDGRVTPGMMKALLKSFQWRNKIGAADRIGAWLIDISKGDPDLREKIVDELLPVAAIQEHPFNMEFINRNFLIHESMAQLDVWWTPHINEKYEDYENNIYKRIVTWAWRIEGPNRVSSASRHLLGLTLAWFFCSSNRALRDCSTKGLVCLYIDHVSEMVSLFDTLSEVKDIYLGERLYAAAYGATVHTNDNAEIKALSDYILAHFFGDLQVLPNVLIRDYAREIIEYSIYRGNYDDKTIREIRSKITPPYGSSMPAAFPSDEDIKMLEEKYKRNQGFECISSSMETGMNYGDFGRYVFKAALTDFIDIDVDQLRNWSTYHILELGYDPEIHDKKRTPYTGRGSNRVERIGKKYQWIVLHELLALVSDNYMMKSDSWTGKEQVLFSGPWKPFVRDIDPTLLIRCKKGLSYRQAAKSWFSNMDYLPVETDGAQWINENVDNVESLIELVDNQGIEWISLCYYPFWNEYPADFDSVEKSETKSMRGYIYSYIASAQKAPKSKDLNTDFRGLIRKALKDINWYAVFEGEYYWSPAYAEYKNECSGLDWEQIKLADGKRIKILQTTQRYIWEEGFDFSKTDIVAYDILTEYLFTNMGLQHCLIPGHYYYDGQLVCMNPSINNEANQSLLIRKDFLCDWLIKNNMKLYWTVKLEKYVSEGRMHDTKLWSDYEGSYYLDGTAIKGNIERTDGNE